MKLYQWFDTLIVAEDEADARNLLKEQRGLHGRSLRSYPIRQVRRSVELCSTSNHDERSMYTPSEAVRACGRGVVPDVS